MNRVIKTAGAVGLVCCVGINGQSVMAADSGWLVGGSVGQTRAKIDDAQITARMLGSGFSSTSIVDDDRDTGYKIFGGYKYNRNFSVESGYFDLGKFGYSATTVPAGTLNGTIKIRGLNLDAVGALPLSEKFSVLGRVGMQYAQVRDTFAGTGSVVVTNPNPKKNSINYKAGVGVQYDLTESLGLRGEWERYRINDGVGSRGHINMVSLGLVYVFGEHKPAPVQRQPAPVEKVMLPKPEVIVITTPAPPPPPPKVITVTAPRKVIFSSDSDADALFNFGKTTLTPIGKRALDKFAAELKGSNYEVITISGHTDRIGSEATNKKLSTGRAEAVKAYLVQSAGIPAHKISAVGVGGSQHLTKPGECIGTKKTKKLIDCLAPDRRVEAEVTSTRPAN